MSLKEKFCAALDVVNSIPYDGTFEPSEEILSKFYAYEMQAIKGRCRSPKPYIWNTIARNRWNTWNELGDMTAESAMENYIEELSKVIETMSYNEKIAKFISLMGTFYEVVSTEEVESLQNQTPPKWSEERIPEAILENISSPTISDLYHIAKTGGFSQISQNYGEAIENNRTILPSNENTQKVGYNYTESHSRLSSSHSQSSLSSSSSDISNFDLLSDYSDNEYNASERDLHYNSRKNCNARQFSTRNDLFILTFINLQTSLESILEKFEHLDGLAKKNNEEIKCREEENNVAEWHINMTGTAFALLWPIVLEVLLG